MPECADGHHQLILGLLKLDRRGGPPLDVHGAELVNIPNLSGKRGFAAEGDVHEGGQHRNILRRQGMAAGTEQIQRLASFKQDGFLGLIDDELGPCAQLLMGILPYQDVGGTVVFQHADDGHVCSPFKTDSLQYVGWFRLRYSTKPTKSLPEMGPFGAKSGSG
ncbi:hypothetical protein D3C76_1233860 [compost metagenome]